MTFLQRTTVMMEFFKIKFYFNLCGQCETITFIVHNEIVVLELVQKNWQIFMDDISRINIEI